MIGNTKKKEYPIEFSIRPPDSLPDKIVYEIVCGSKLISLRLLCNLYEIRTFIIALLYTQIIIGFSKAKADKNYTLTQWKRVVHTTSFGTVENR